MWKYVTLPAPQKDFVNLFFVFAWEFCIEKWWGFLVTFFRFPFPMKRSTKTPRKIRGKFGAKFGVKFGTKIRKFGELSFCNFSGLKICHNDGSYGIKSLGPSVDTEIFTDFSGIWTLVFFRPTFHAKWPKPIFDDFSGFPPDSCRFSSDFYWFSVIFNQFQSASVNLSQF